MKNIVRIISILMAVLIIASLVIPALAVDTKDTYTLTDQVVYAQDAVNVRTGPGVKYERIGHLKFGESIRRIAIGSNGWSIVIYKGEPAYMSSYYLDVKRPSGYASKVDDSSLKKQIAIANGLNKAEYTIESWEVMDKALSKAARTMGGKNQTAADNAAKELEAAIAALVRVDYSKLEAAMSAARALIESQPREDLWNQLMAAMEQADALLASGDQAAVYAAADEINALIALLKEAIREQNKPDVIVQTPDDQIPEGKAFCNKTSHLVWQVVAIVSIAVNLLLVGIIVTYLMRKKQKRRDDVPLVDYDIYDDSDV